MNKSIFNLKLVALGAIVLLSSCVDDDFPEVGDLIDLTGPTPFYNTLEITTAEFTCDDTEVFVNYQVSFEAGSNLAVNGTSYEWTVNPSEGVEFVNKDVPVIERLIDAELASVRDIESQIAALEFKIPCEEDQAKVDVFEAEIVELNILLTAAEEALTDEVLANVADLENQLASLQAATLQDQELIFSFPSFGDYIVGLTVTDNLGKSDFTEKIITINKAVPTIPTPEIGEPGFDDNTLFDGSGDGRDSWRAPSSSLWGSVFQINTVSELGILPDGVQAAKFPSDGTRAGYQEIDVTPGAEYTLTYFTEFADDTFGDVTVSILDPTVSDAASISEENTIATRTETNVGRTEDVFIQHAITFEAGDNDTVIIYITNSGVESRVDAFAIIVKQ